MVTFDANDPGTSAHEWQADERWARMPTLSLDGVTGLVVLAAHPDDETLGAGGLIATAVTAGLPVTVVVVTDGDASGPADSTEAQRRALANERAAELGAAMAELGVDGLRMLGFPDGGVREHRADVEVALRVVLEEHPGALLVATYRGDGHRDHRVLGEVAAALAEARGLTLWAYPIWLWHWATPGHGDVPWAALARFTPSPLATRAKARALTSFRSQVEGEWPVLHARFLEHFAGPGEVFVTATGATG